MLRVSKLSLGVVLTVIGAPVLADPGHLIEVAGHAHWGALIALGGAVAVGLWGAKGKKKPPEEEIAAQEAEEISDVEPQEA